jgi:hypothetical protein
MGSTVNGVDATRNRAVNDVDRRHYKSNEINDLGFGMDAATQSA